jgi:hypothetical protein
MKQSSCTYSNHVRTPYANRRPAAIVAALSAALLCCALGATAAAEETAAGVGADSTARPYYVGTSMFVLANLVPWDYPPFFLQLNAGYRLTPRDTLSVEAITWRYYHPLGIPYWGGSFESPDEEYPGHVREYGVGLAYQRFLWKGIYSSLSAVPFWRQYYDSRANRIGNGFQLFLTLRLGYHLVLMDRVFLEPSIAFTHWPVSTNVPEEFAVLDKKWPSYFLFEPGLHAGVKF